MSVVGRAAGAAQRRVIHSSRTTSRRIHRSRETPPASSKLELAGKIATWLLKESPVTKFFFFVFGDDGRALGAAAAFGEAVEARRWVIRALLSGRTIGRGWRPVRWGGCALISITHFPAEIFYGDAQGP